MTANRLVAGVDSSTQSTKVVIRRLDDGAVVAEGRAPHPATEPPRSEQDPQAWWSALVEAFGHANQQLATTGAGSGADVVAVSVSGQQHGLVVLDDQGRPLRPAKLWNDTESAPQADRLVADLGAEAWATACGVVPVASITVSKLAWLADHEPGTLDRVSTILLPHDYLTWRLSGRAVTDRGDASGTGWWDPASGRYRPELLAAAVGERAETLARCLPDVLGPTEAAGTIAPDAATELGLADGVAIGPGTGDNMAAALGLGLRPGEVAMSLGTSGTVFGVADVAARDTSGLVAGFADATGSYLPLACTLNATKVTDMVATILGVDHQGLADLALSVAAGSGGATVVPYFDGERTPNLPDATGMITGLRPGTSRADLARAAHEGVLSNLLAAADALAAVGVTGGDELRLVGGGAKSAAYQQILADLHQGPVRIPADDEAPATGAAVQAAAVVGEEGIDAVTDRWGLRDGGVVVEPSAAPDPSVRARYASAASAAAELAQP
jgi:xylulokinase